MRVRYTRRGALQLDAILEYIETHSPDGARNVMDRIEATLVVLAAHPYSGRMTSRAGLRRIVVLPYPYAIVYRPTKSEIVIHGVRHAARRPS